MDRSFHLKRDEDLSAGLRRIAAGRAEKALRALRDGDADRAEAVHEARKDLKKLRAALRLGRGQLGEALFAAESRRYRDAGRLLSHSRDAEVRWATAVALGQRFGPELPADVYLPWVLTLERERDEAAGRGAEPGEDRERAAAAIAAGREAIDAWPPGKDSWKAIGQGLRRAYGKGRHGLGRTAAEPSAENVHQWRKRAKDLTYQLRILREAWPQGMGEAAERSHHLTDLLGDHHDLELLAEDLKARGVERRSELEALVRRRQEELLEEALELGRHLYAEKPKAFERRIRAYWKVSRSTSRG